MRKPLTIYATLNTPGRCFIVIIVDFLFHATGLFLQPLKTENVFEKISNSFYSFNLYLKIVRQFLLKNLATFASRLSKCAWPFWGIIYYWVKTSRLKRANNVLKYIYFAKLRALCCIMWLSVGLFPCIVLKCVFCYNMFIISPIGFRPLWSRTFLLVDFTEIHLFLVKSQT